MFQELEKVHLFRNLQKWEESLFVEGCYVAGTIPGAKSIFSFSPPQHLSEVGIITPILLPRKLNLREIVKAASKW